MRSPPELRSNPLAFRDSGGRQAEQGEDVNFQSPGALRRTCRWLLFFGEMPLLSGIRLFLQIQHSCE